MGVSSEKRCELESLRQSTVVFDIILAAHAMPLVPDYSCPVIPLDPSASWRGGHAAWEASCPPYHTPKFES